MLVFLATEIVFALLESQGLLVITNNLTFIINNLTLIINTPAFDLDTLALLIDELALVVECVTFGEYLGLLVSEEFLLPAREEVDVALVDLKSAFFGSLPVLLGSRELHRFSDASDTCILSLSRLVFGERITEPSDPIVQ
jgi:hypothetical protein